MDDFEKVKNDVHVYDSHAFDYEKLKSEFNVTQEDVDALRQMSKSIEAIPQAMFDRIHLLILITCENDKEKGLKMLHDYCRLKNKFRAFSTERNIEDPKIQHALNTQFFATLAPTPNNYSVMIYKLSNSKPDYFEFDTTVKTFFMTIEWHVIQFGPRNGVVFILDMEGFSLGHVFKPKLKSLRNLLTMANEGCPFKIREIHVLNAPWCANGFLAIIKPFMNVDLLKLVRVYPKKMNMEKFYQECIPKSCLPAEYGGDLESIEILLKKNIEILYNIQGYFSMKDLLMKFELEGIDFGVK